MHDCSFGLRNVNTAPTELPVDAELSCRVSSGSIAILGDLSGTSAFRIRQRNLNRIHYRALNWPIKVSSEHSFSVGFSSERRWPMILLSDSSRPGPHPGHLGLPDSRASSRDENRSFGLPSRFHRPTLTAWLPKATQPIRQCVALPWTSHPWRHTSHQEAPRAHRLQAQRDRERSDPLFD